MRRPATPTADANPTKETLRELIYRFLFGNDIFISYARADAADYALTLASRLTKANYLCFLDQLGTRPGYKPPPELLQTIRRSTVFVLIASEEAIGSGPIATEIREFLATGRPIVPIDFNGALERAEWRGLIPGIARKLVIQEQGKVSSRPTSSTVRGIGDSFNYTRRNAWLRGLLISAIVIFVATVFGSGYVVTSAKWDATTTEIEAAGNAMFSNIAANEAKYERVQAERLTKQAEGARDRAQQDAVTAGLRAAVETDKANKAEARQQTAEKNAIRQEEIATAHQLANQADLTLKQRPNLLPRSTLYALESMRRFNDLGMRSLDADLAVRDELSLLLPLERTAEIKANAVDHVAMAPNGRFLAAASLDGVTLFNIAANQNIQLPLSSKALNAYSPLAVSANGKYLVTVEDDPNSYGSLTEVWDPVTGRAVAPAVVHQGRIKAITISSDGEYLAFALGRFVQVSDTVSGRSITAPLAHDKDVSDIAFSTEEGHRYLATAAGGHARIWDLTKPVEPKAIIKISEPTVEKVIFDSAGKHLATVGSAAVVRKSVEVWDWKTNQVAPIVPPISYHTILDILVAFSEDGKHLATASGSDSVRIADLTNSDVQAVQPKSFISALAFDPTGTTLATGGGDNTARIWNVASGQEVARVYHDFDNDHQWSVRLLAFSADGKQLTTASSDKTVRVWNVARGEPIATTRTRGHINGLAFSPKGDYFATAEGWLGMGNSASVWDAFSGREVSVVNTHRGAVNEVAFDPSGKYMVTASDDGSLCVWDKWDTEPQAHKVVCVNFPAKVHAVAFSSDGQYLAVGRSDKVAVILKDWQTQSPQTVSTINHPDSVQSVAFAPNTHYLATGCNDGIARVWRWQYSTQAPIANLRHGPAIMSLAFSPDGRYLVTAGFNRTADVWDWREKSSKPIATLQHELSLSSVAFDPSGRYLATSGSDYATRVWEKWNTKSPLEVARIRYEAAVTRVAFSADGRHILTGNEDRTAQLYLWQPTDLIHEACDRLRRNLDTEEWNAYLSTRSYRRTCVNLPGP